VLQQPERKRNLKMKRNLKRKHNQNLMFNVELRAFLKGQLRVVTVPGKDLDRAIGRDQILDLIFKYGQNDFQPQQQPSVSMGDVIRFEGDRYLILSVGFRKLKPGEFVNTQPQLSDVLPTNRKAKKLGNISSK
jgi:hypothetical protein